MALRLAAVRDAGVTPPSTAPARPVRVGDMVYDSRNDRARLTVKVWNRIAELEASLALSRECCADRQEWAGKVDERANRLSDEAGALRTELQAVKAENSDLRRTIERLERKGGRR